MKRVLVASLVCMSIVMFFGMRSDPGLAETSAAFVPGELIVFFTDRESTVLQRTTEGGVTTIYHSLNAILAEYGVLDTKALFGPRSPLRNAYLMRFPEEARLDELIQRLESLPSIRSVGKNYLMKVDLEPDDYYFNHDFNGDGRLDQWTFQRMELDRAWGVTTGDPDVVVGLIDTGFDWEHPDLDSNVVWINPDEDINHNNRFDNYPSSEGGDLDTLDNDINGYTDDVIGWDFWNGDNDPSPPDTADGNHGTVVGSIITAETNQGNAYGVAGASWNGRIMVLRAGNEFQGVGIDDAIAAINYAIANGASIINMSFSSEFDITQLHDAIEDADAAGLIMVGSAGDDVTEDPMYPGSYPEVIRVAAVDSTTVKTTGSNYGTDVTISAPSAPTGRSDKGIVTCNFGTSSGYWGDQEPHIFLHSEVATSGGAAEVTGVVALIKAVNPGADKEFIVDELVRGATPLDDPLYAQGKLGAGMANAYRSVTQWGTLEESTTWSNAAFVSGDLTVASGKTLTIAPGTTVWIAGDDNEHTGGDTDRIEFVVNGYLDIQGTAENPVVLKAWNATGRDAWTGLFFTPSGQGGNLEHVVIKNASTGIEHFAPVTASNVTISDCEIGVNSYADLDMSYSTVTLCTDYGIRVQDGDANLEHVEISYSDQHGIVAQPYHPTADIEVLGAYVNIHHNGMYGAYVTGDVNSFEIAFSECRHNYIGVVGGLDPPVEVTRSTVEYNDTGVLMANGDVSGVCVINNNTTNGIYLAEGSEGLVIGNVISSNQVGIYCTGAGTNPIIFQNDIESGGVGIFSDHSATGTVARNQIKFNGTGVLANNNAKPDLGDGSGSPLDGYNSIYGNSGFHVANFSTRVTIKAENNYWGEHGPLPFRFYGLVDYYPYLDEQPGPWAPAMSEAHDGGLPRVPTRFALTGIHPNPFNPSTTVEYDVPDPGGHVRIDVFDVAGRLVTKLVDEDAPPGSHRVVWYGRDWAGRSAASGVYFVRMTAGGVVETNKIVLLK
jgi:parallel beta-helix repeat protein